MLLKVYLALSGGQCYIYHLLYGGFPPHITGGARTIGILQTHFCQVPSCNSPLIKKKKKTSSFRTLASLLYNLWSLSSNWLFKIIPLLFTEVFDTWLPASVSNPIHAIIPEDSKVQVYDPFIRLALKYLGLLNSRWHEYRRNIQKRS